MKTDNEARRDGQIAYLHAIAKLKEAGLSTQALQFLYRQRPIGIDSNGRIVIQQENTITADMTERDKTLQLVSRELQKGDWATGLSFKYANPPAAHHNRFKKLLFLPAFLVNMTLPHRPVNGNEFSRRNGALQLSLLAPRSVGLPYGVYARLILMYLTTKRVTSKERRFRLGSSWRDFLQQMGIAWSSGPRGSYTAAQDQLRRLCATLYTVHDARSERESIDNVLVADRWLRSDNGVYVSLSESFFTLSGKSVVPLETKIVHSLRRSPLMLDLYAWLTYRTYITKQPTIVPWRALERQFGADYTRPRAFRAKFRSSLETVLEQSSAAPQVDVRAQGLHLTPGGPSDIDWVERLRLAAKSHSL